MDVVGKKVESQVQFWSLLGPFFVLLSIAVLLFKVSPHWYFSAGALIGIPLCVKWKMKGMAAALCCLFLLAGISYPSIELDDRYWHVGLSLAMAFSFIVLTLSLEEVQGLVGKLQLESQSRLDNFLLLDEKWKTAENEWRLEREKSRSDIATSTRDIAVLQEDKQTFYKLAQLSKDELVQVRKQHDQLLQDLLYKKQQIAQLNERLEGTEMTIQGFVNSDSEKQIQALTDSIACLEREKEIFKAKVALAQEEKQACQIEKEKLLREFQECQEREKLCLSDQQRFQQDRQDQQSAFQLLQSKCALMEQERQGLIQTQAKLQQQYEQIRQVESQYRQTVQQSQQKIQDLELKLAEEEKSKEILKLRKKEVEEHLIYQEKQMKLHEEQHKATLQQLQDELEREKYRTEVELKQHQQQLLEQGQHEQKILVQEIKTLQERCQTSQEGLLKTQQELEGKNAVLIQMQEKVNHLSNELQEQRSLLKESAEQKQVLESLKVQLEQSLQQTKSQLDDTAHKLDLSHKQRISHPQEDKLPYAPGNTRQIESMYIQLKEQFQEKCNVLDSTRRDLFQVNEELLKYQKDFEEENVYGLSSNEKQLQRHIVRLGKQFDQMQHLYQQEMDDLTNLVGHLLRQIKN